MTAVPAQAQALQRLVMLTTALSAAGSRGWHALPLAERLGFGGTEESKRESLAREVRRLRSIGIEILNVAGPGAEARYVLHPADSRIQLAFDPAQRAQLARAALTAGRRSVAAVLAEGAAPEPNDPVVETPVGLGGRIDVVLRAVTARCQLRFTYNGRPRLLDPLTLVHDRAGWAVVGHERQAGERRTFSVSRMSEVDLGAPGSAAIRDEASREGAGTDPLTWLVDQPVTARVRTPVRYSEDMTRLLGPPEIAARDADLVTAAYRVTNRWVFLARVIELGERVVLLGPDALRAELRDRLLVAIR